MIVVYGALFGYIFPMLASHNQALLADMELRKKEFEDLQSEKRSFELGQRDIKVLAGKPYQPEELFNTDKRVVKEIEQLESIAAENNIKLQLQVTGTSDKAIKVPKTVSGVLSVPYILNLTGEFGDLVAFIERLEHLSFVTHVQGVQFLTGEGDTIKATLKAQFYIHKWKT